MTKRYHLGQKRRFEFENKRKVLYIHGFMSGANSSTAIRLMEHNGYKYDFITPELNGDPHESLAIINDIIAKEKPCMIIGSSLGGFYALVSESHDIPVIVVNPCVDPYTHMQRYLDKELEYHSKRKDGRTKYVLTRQTLEHFKDYDLAEKVKSKISHIIPLLSSKDEILGDSHYQFFKKIAEEMNLDSGFIIYDNQFGHRAYPFGISWLDYIIYEVMHP